MKMLAARIPEELYVQVKQKLAQNGQTMDSNIKNLLSADLNVEIQKNNARVICFKIPENEYTALKSVILNRGITIKGFVENLILQDLNEDKPTKHFENEDTRGREKTICFNTDGDLFTSMKRRIVQINMSSQDYLKSLVYSITHHELTEETVEDQTIGMSM